MGEPLRFNTEVDLAIMDASKKWTMPIRTEGCKLAKLYLKNYGGTSEI